MTDLFTALRAEVKQNLHEQHSSMREVVTGMSADALNWKPVEGANSICVLISHALDAERFLTSTAVKVEVARDRESHFRATAADSDELLALIDRAEAENEAYLDRMQAED